MRASGVMVGPGRKRLQVAIEDSLESVPDGVDAEHAWKDGGDG